jgi:hypothetical protein
MRHEGQLPQFPQGLDPSDGELAADDADEALFIGELDDDEPDDDDDEEDDPRSPARPKSPLRPKADVVTSSLSNPSAPATSFRLMPAIFASSARDWHWT